MSKFVSKSFGAVSVSQLPHNIWRIESQPGEDLDIQDIVPLANWIKDNVPVLPYKSLLVGGYGSTVSPGVQSYLATPERKDRVAREAIVIRSFAHRLIANFYIRYRKPQILTHVFESEEEAISWLNEV